MEVLMHEASDTDRIEIGPSTVSVAHSRALKPAVRNKERDEDANCSGNPSLFARANERGTLDLIFEKITYTVSLGFRKGEKEILHGVNGRLPASQLIALMGPSGAGKSTLLDVLSGFRTTGVTGSVLVNGRVRDLDSFRKCSAYITQDDRLEPLLTVMESMQIAADLKLPVDTPREEKDTIIEQILTMLGLYDHLSTRAERLSGGQKKRLSIALELVNNPTVMFLDEPTTGLDSSSCMQVVNLLKLLARQGRTIICTIHQPSASLFQLFDQVYVLAKGECLYQGATDKLIPYLENIKLPCPMYHNPADYVIELSCGEYGEDKIASLVAGSQNGTSLEWFADPRSLKDAKSLRASNPIKKNSQSQKKTALQATPLLHQIKILLRRRFLMCKRDKTLTYLRIIVNIITGFMLGLVFVEVGDKANRILDNYNLLFAILIHHMMSTMMLTVVTFPTQMSILIKEHFNRWYSLKAFYVAITLIDIPVSLVACHLFTMIVYLLSSQPMEMTRFMMFFVVSLLVTFIAQGIGLMIGAIFDVVNGTFAGPTLAVPLMMFAGFGVTLRDLPAYLKWGSYVSYLRYGLEGFVGAIYGFNRPPLKCDEAVEIYCHYKHPIKFLTDVDMKGDQFWTDIIALSVILLITRSVAFFLLRWKISSIR